ncbi:MAG TPA: hypothetical protein VFJ47_11175 [Terriglobales bacterium]|nr:hypothetical protein [Terriglobales bacterium]
MIRLLLFAGLSSALLAGALDSQKAPAENTALPVVTFTLDFPQSDPEHYSIRVANDGHASYDSSEKPSPESEQAETFHFNFTLGEVSRRKIFDLAAQARYFQSHVESKHRVASTGTKILAYRDAQRSNQTTYNYSQIPAVQELTNLFQNMAQTLEFVRRLQYDYRYQKLALDEELKRMEEMAKTNTVSEMQAAEPILKQIAADPSVINVVRARAQRLAALAQGNPATR